MQKTGLKTFVYSFALSLFAIFTANGIYWHTRPSASQEVKIPSKNIMLFLRGNRDTPSTRPAPLKKIALTVLPEPRQQETPPYRLLCRSFTNLRRKLLWPTTT